MKVNDLESIKIKIASPEDILEWSNGEVVKPETINYRTQKAEKDGLFCEKIFGPEKDYQCYCGKYKRIRYKGVICDRCGVEVITSKVRRERMGHIKLACPVSHIWFLRSVPSRIGLILNIPGQQLEKVIYFAAYIITDVNKEEKNRALEQVEREYKEKSKIEIKNQKEASEKQMTKLKKSEKITKSELKKARNRAIEEIMSLRPLKVLSEIEYQQFSLKYGQVFTADTGAESLKKIFEKIDLKKEIQKLKKEITEAKIKADKKKLVRLRFLQRMFKERINPDWMFLTIIPVLPPDLRPMVQLDGGRFASSDLNDLYRRVINRNNRLKYLLEISAPEVIVRNEKRMLQEAVDALIDNSMRKGTMTQATTGGRRLLKSVADMLKGKHGRFRQNLLGKRVDYSGRSVIIVGPELRLHQAGLPKKMALELFKPFVLKRILDQELAYNIKGASRLIDEQTDEVWAILEQVVKNKLVLLNRAPTLHRLGIQAFEPVLIEGEAIRIHPLVCKAFNADFDGDQMAVHVPLSKEAQQEAKERMLSTYNLLKPANGRPIVAPSQDIVLGCFWLTSIDQRGRSEKKIFSSFEEAVLIYEMGNLDLRAKIKVRIPQLKKQELKSKNSQSAICNSQIEVIETTVGRILFNETLPSDYPFQNKVQDIRTLEKIIGEIINNYSLYVAEEVLDGIKSLGFEISTLAGISWGIDDLSIPSEKPGIITQAEERTERMEKQYYNGLLSKEERKNKIIEIWQKAKIEIEKVTAKALPDQGSVYAIVESGSRGSWSQIVQMSGMKGLVINPLGQIIELPVKNSYKEGFNVLEYFISTHGARKGTVDTALRTSTAGYLTRRLIDIAHEIIISIEDCGDKKGVTVFRKTADDIGQDFAQKIVGRVTIEKIQDPKSKKVIIKKGEIIDWEIAQEIIDAGVEKLQIRSCLSCKAKKGICQKCYGWDLGRNQLVILGEAVGVLAAQAIGEPGTQLTMRTFHTGGVAGVSDITFGLPRAEEIFEIRAPKGKAQALKVDGRVLEITSDRVVRIQPLQNLKSNKKKISKKEEIVEYQIAKDQAILIEKGQIVKKGQALCEGSLDIRELFKLISLSNVYQHIIQEVQKIYVSQGAIIHDKHIEVIVRQMFSKIKVEEEGDSCFAKGEIIELVSFIEEQERLKKEGKNLAQGKQLLLGISQAALATNSFLSAASFQETSRILIEAALSGKKDELRGLKENVIIGKLIPAGTGFKK